MRHIMTALTTLFMLSSCGTSGSTGNSTPGGPGNPPPGGTAANTLTGQVLDPAGKPIAGAEIWIKPVSYSGLIKTTTDAQGRYRSVELNPAIAPYDAQAYKKITYHGEQYCLRMGGETTADVGVFNARDGAVRNFRWKTQGPAEGGYDDKTWGGSFRFYNESVMMDGNIEPNEILEVKLIPNGPLLDGSAGEDWEYTTYAGTGVKDIPVGRYDMSASIVNADGTKTPIKLKADNSVQSGAWGTKITVLFDGLPDCGHYATFLETPIAMSR